MENKKAQGMSVNTIILIILALIVLVVLVLGFVKGWGNIKDWITPSNNVKSIVDQCGIACGTEQKYSFCSESRTLKAKDESGNKIKIENTNCYQLSVNPGYKIYGIQECLGLCGEEVETGSGEGADVSAVVEQCKAACNLDKKYDYCTKFRTLEDQTGIEIVDTTCYELATTESYKKYGIEECLAITCD